MRQSFSKLTIQKRYVFLFLPSQIHESTGYPKLHVQEIIASQFNESHPRLYWSGGSEKEVRYESYQAWRRRKQLIIRQVRVKVENLSATRPLQINRAKSITETNEQLSKKKKKREEEDTAR